MAKKISTEEVKSKLDKNENFYLIDTLAANSFEARHIPGAKSMPYGTDFIKQFEQVINAQKDAEIITYCASNGCQLSALAANALEEAGYTNVGHYVDGLAGWQNAGHKFEGEATK
ncbi:MAG: rhodanese-like domain-containing protein [Candidatus Ryanbacteria bacterium CG10_big_fil_rev_8_21_14_0_10_43_42]|uniref:Rhodanese-like domain-containing protein n=1 Tax=Candidatus Ryanbacteria bacterium CG10_big_fil_rev_8_21_14_0_10_43_42 TaxID=1974864 RepID=A0A2M8KWU5_9BACT|nr:MAG: rhodanese-like domain-containing protein [Candidatus Ryanbacteria bacterium CG10_big_fil_rev_8_21_14_0_10_43_42]